MGVKPWIAPDFVKQLLETVFEKHHGDRLADLRVSVSFDDSKPFSKNRMNLGKLVKFSDLQKIHMQVKFDYGIVVCSDLWHSVLNDKQREAYIDLHLTRVVPEYKPVTVKVNGKDQAVKDEFGRVEYTTDLKLDKNGDPIWRVQPLDLWVFAANARKYGLWMEDMEEFDAACRPQKATPALTDAAEVAT